MTSKTPAPSNNAADAHLGLPSFMTAEMEHARLGIVYLFSHLTCEDDAFCLATDGILDLFGSRPTALANLPGGSNVTKLLAALEKATSANEAIRHVTSGDLAKATLPAATATEAALRDTLARELEKMATLLAAQTRDQVGSGDAAPGADASGTDIWASLPAPLSHAVRQLAGVAAAWATPFVANGLTTAEGLVDALENGVKRYLAHARGKTVAVLPGAPSSMIDGIKRAMDSALKANAYTALKGGSQLVVEGVTAGASAPFGRLVFSVIDALVAIVRRAHDLYYMRRFFNEAQAHWADRERADAFHKRPFAFNEWYRAAALRVPVLPVLTLNSGICGDKAHMLRMFTKDGERITQARFDDGVHYIDELKTWGAGYLAGVGYRFRSNEAVIAELVKSVAVPATESLRSKLWKHVKALLP